jgi:cell division cycle 14
MRIVRPGCVVGPQQQYMYLKQLEWSKWAAIDETQKAQLKNASPTPALVTPATPPAEADDDSDAMQTTPPSILPTSVSLPPVTPSRHIANGTAKAMAIATPGQPRKTPQTKRVASDSDEEEADDVLPALDIAPIIRPRTKTSRVAGKITSSESRPTRVTRSTAGAAAIRKAGGTSSTDTLVKGSQQGPNKIPRLATTRTPAAAKAAVAATPATRREPPPPPQSPPPPSRLPTLAKRVATNGLPDLSALKRPASAAANAWMKNNASAVVVPATKSGRPGLRSVRKRRSSFSAADVIA